MFGFKREIKRKETELEKLLRPFNQQKENRIKTKRLKLVKKIIESVLFFFFGFMINLSFSRQLDYITNILLFVGAILMISYIAINECLQKRETNENAF